MIDKSRIEKVIKSSVGRLESADLIHNVWHCLIHIPKNVDARLGTLQKAFPNMHIKRRNGNEVLCLIPSDRQAPIEHNNPMLHPSVIAQRMKVAVNGGLQVTPGTLPLDQQITRLVEVYEAIFERECEIQMIDETRLRLGFEEDLKYPYQNPLLTLLPRLLPGQVPVAISTDHLTQRPNTSVYIAPQHEVVPHQFKHVVINIDGGFRDGIGCYGVRYLMTGHPPAYLSGAVNCRDSNGAELIAFLQALAHLDASVQNVLIYTDSTFVRSWVTGEGQQWFARALERHGQVTLRWISREDNKAAHSLANKALRRLFS